MAKITRHGGPSNIEDDRREEPDGTPIPAEVAEKRAVGADSVPTAVEPGHGDTGTVRQDRGSAAALPGRDLPTEDGGTSKGQEAADERGTTVAQPADHSASAGNREGHSLKPVTDKLGDDQPGDDGENPVDPGGEQEPSEDPEKGQERDETPEADKPGKAAGMDIELPAVNALRSTWDDTLVRAGVSADWLTKHNKDEVIALGRALQEGRMVLDGDGCPQSARKGR